MKHLYEIIPRNNALFEPVRRYTTKLYIIGVLLGFVAGFVARTTISTFWWL